MNGNSITVKQAAELMGRITEKGEGHGNKFTQRYKKLRALIAQIECLCVIQPALTIRNIRQQFPKVENYIMKGLPKRNIFATEQKMQKKNYYKKIGSHKVVHRHSSEKLEIFE